MQMKQPGTTPCTECGAKGRLQDVQSCQTCQGKGTRYRLFGKFLPYSCKDCKGEGRVLGIRVKCATCDGNGKIPYCHGCGTRRGCICHDPELLRRSREEARRSMRPPTPCGKGCPPGACDCIELS